MFSLHVRVALRSELGQRLAYLQHIAALAVIEGVRSLPGCQVRADKIRIPYFAAVIEKQILTQNLDIFIHKMWIFDVSDTYFYLII